MIKKEDISQEVFDLYDDCANNRIHGISALLMLDYAGLDNRVNTKPP